ncbi:MAG: type II toxin-antitoxin system death-on-curing family toxin [Halobacteriales archaeon]|nr:type II toxin-antitoxin system death-on-curing family toxin [Halobacteriales archaeon]
MFDPYDPSDEFASDGGDSDIRYPSVSDVYEAHEAVVEEDENVLDGVVNEGQIEYALDYIKHGHFDEVPVGIFEKAAYLLCLIIKRHEFIDGNKRTALYTTKAFLEMNGYEMKITNDLLVLVVYISKSDNVDIDDIEDALRGATHIE